MARLNVVKDYLSTSCVSPQEEMSLSTTQQVSKTLKDTPLSLLIGFLDMQSFLSGSVFDYWKHLIESSGNINCADSDGENLLMLAMRFGTPDDVLFLLEIGLDPLYYFQDDEEDEFKHPLLDGTITRKDDNVIVFLRFCQNHSVVLSDQIILLAKKNVPAWNASLLSHFSTYQERMQLG